MGQWSVEGELILVQNGGCEKMHVTELEPSQGYFFPAFPIARDSLQSNKGKKRKKIPQNP